MITLHWDGDALTDDGCENEYAYIVWQYQQGIPYEAEWCSENIYNRIRLGIVMGEIDCSRVRFEFNDQDIYPNRFGAIPDWPNGWCDYNVSIAEKILKAAMLKRKAEREGKSK